MHDWLFTYRLSFREFTDNPCHILLLYASLLYLHAYLLCGFGVLANEHDAAGESVESVARQRIPLVTSLSAHDFDDGVIVVASGRVDGYTCWLVDDDHIVVLMNCCDGLCTHGRFMAM